MKVMKVYVVQGCRDHEGCDARGAFSDLEKAELFVSKIVRDYDRCEIQTYHVEVKPE